MVSPINSSSEKVVSAKPVSKPKPPVTKRSYTIEDSKLIESVQFMKQNNLLGVDKSSPNFDSVKEAEDYAKESVVSAIKDKVNSLKSDISDLQKEGYELHLESIRLLKIPLKLRVWQSNPLKKELEAMYAVINPVASLVEQYKKELEQKTKQEEALDKQKEDEWENIKEARKKEVEQMSMSFKPKPSSQPIKNLKPPQPTSKKVLKKPVSTVPTKPKGVTSVQPIKKKVLPPKTRVVKE